MVQVAQANVNSNNSNDDDDKGDDNHDGDNDYDNKEELGGAQPPPSYPSCHDRTGSVRVRSLSLGLPRSLRYPPLHKSRVVLQGLYDS